jgi:hypothetical protein
VEFKELLQRHYTELYEIENKNYDIRKQANLSIISCRRILTKMNQIVLDTPFQNEAAEITFFKKIKSIPLSKLIYNSKILNLENQYPKANKKEQAKYIKKKIRKINNGKRGGDKMRISESNGNPINLEKQGDSFCLLDTEKQKIIKFLNILGELTGWKFIPRNWTFNKFSVYKFSKGSLKPSNKRFNELMEKNPLSWAMTSTLAIEYTLEKPDKLP